jgi:hypothetical protein
LLSFELAPTPPHHPFVSQHLIYISLSLAGSGFAYNIQQVLEGGSKYNEIKTAWPSLLLIVLKKGSHVCISGTLYVQSVQYTYHAKYNA